MGFAWSFGPQPGCRHEPGAHFAQQLDDISQV